MSTRRRCTLSGLVVVAVIGSVLTSCSSNSTAQGPTTQVTIVRDHAGIPHITASNFTALGYGDAWAFAQDNLCTLAEDFVTVNGQRSRYFGAKGLSLNYSAGTQDSNLNSDFFWQSVKEGGIATAQLDQPPPIGPLPQVLSVYRGFIAGYNAYLASGDLHDPRCLGKPWVRPITMTDMLLRGVQITTEASSAQVISDEVAAVPPSGPTPTTTTTAALRSVTPTGTSGGPSFAAGLATSGTSVTGSNGIGLGSQDTAGGDGMLLANPHFPWQGTERFWMAQLTVPGQYNVLGGTLEGFPLIGIGFNQHLAWTHTVSTSYRFTFYQLQLVPGDPTSYLVDGQPHKMGTVVARVDTGHGIQHHTFYTTQWGRVLVVPQANYHWTSTTAYAFDDATIGDGTRAANQYLEMGEATSVQSLLDVESTYLAIPTFNTIAADDTGHALYGDVGNTPNVSQALISSCTPSGAASLVYAAAGVVTLDGSRAACAWATDPGTPVPGIFNASHMPHTIRTDYVENSNDSYWLANPGAPFPAFSPIIGNIDTIQGLRTRLGNQMIAARVAGTDGLGPPKFTISTLQQMWQGDQSLEAQLVLDALVADCRATPSANATDGKTVALAQACTALAGYDKTGKLDASGGWLFSEWAAYAPTNAGEFWADAFNPAAPITTPSQLKTSNPAMLTALADAVENLRSHDVPLDATYGQVQHATRNGTRIPIPGCDTGCFNAIYASDGQGGPLSAFPYGQVHDGSSLVMTTELTPQGPISQGILTYSQATDPTSPWYSNMTTLYSQGRWVPLAYTAAQLARAGGGTTVTLDAPT